MKERPIRIREGGDFSPENVETIMQHWKRTERCWPCTRPTKTGNKKLRYGWTLL